MRLADTTGSLTPVASGIAASRGVRISWARYGTAGPFVLFVPTWNLVDSRVVAHQVAFLAPHARVLTYDPRGAGRSERPAHGYSFAHHLADALAVLDANDARSASVVTASRGVNTAVLLAARHPERIDRLVSIAPYMHFEPGDPARAEQEIAELAALWRLDWPGFVLRFITSVFSEPDSQETISEVVAIALEASPDVLIQQERELEWDAVPPLLGRLRCPVLVIHGSDDRTTPASLARTVTDRVRGARLVLLDGAGHRPDIREPGRVNMLLAGFIGLSAAR